MSNLLFEPGYYTKIRIGDAGNIVDVGDLELGDLPKHSHGLADLNQDEIKDLVSEILSTFFANNQDNAVQFKYDSKTKTVSADINIDEETIYKNEYGQLVSAGSGENSGSANTGSGVTEQQLKNLQDKIPGLIQDTLSQVFSNSANSAVVFSWDKVTKTVSADVNIDGLTIQKNEYGSLVSEGSGSGGDGGNCASHTHTTDQIEDFHKAVVNIFNDYSKNINIDITKYIDGNTIKINEYGQLVAVRTALERHTHKLEDIVDYVAPDPAATQLMTDLGEDVDYDQGIINFEHLNIGYSILALSQYIKEIVNKNIEKINKKVDELGQDDDNTGVSILTIHPDSKSNLLLDTSDNVIKTVYYAPSVYLNVDFLPYDEGSIILYKNGVEVSRTSVDGLRMIGDTVDRFTVADIYTKNKFLARILKVEVGDLLTDEGVCKLQIAFKPSDTTIDFINEVVIYSTNNQKIPITFKDTTPTHTFDGKQYYDKDCPYSYRLRLEDYQKYRFLNPYSGFIDGYLYGVTDVEKTVSIPNLFENTLVQLRFELQRESSSSWLFNLLTETAGGSIIDDVIVPREGNKCRCTFELNNSEEFNTVKIKGNIPLEDIRIRKGDLVATGTVPASLEFHQSGYIPTKGDFSLITFVDNYDAGIEPIFLDLITTEPLNIRKVRVDCINI